MEYAFRGVAKLYNPQAACIPIGVEVLGMELIFLT